MKQFKMLLLVLAACFALSSCTKDGDTLAITENACDMNDTTQIKDYFVGVWEMNYNLQSNYPICEPLLTFNGAFEFSQIAAAQLATIWTVGFEIKEGSRTLTVGIAKMHNEAAATFTVNFGGDFGRISNEIVYLNECADGFTVQGACGLLTIKRVR